MGSRVFEFSDYRDYINARIAQMPRKGHGMRGRLAEGVGCQPAYFSQVLRKKAHLNLEQAQKLIEELGDPSIDVDYFLYLLQFQRAGTQSLRDYFQSKMDALKSESLKLSKKFELASELSDEQRSTYYSEWYYSAAHISLTLGKVSSAEDVAQALSLPLKKSRQVVEFLLEASLAVQGDEGLEVGPARIHLENDSPHISRHHSNWRMQAMQSLTKVLPEELHYSSVVSLSEEDFLKIRKVLDESISRAKDVVRPSEPERLASFNLDFFFLDSSA